MVAGYHNRRYSRAAAGFDRLICLFARRILHADKPAECQPRLAYFSPVCLARGDGNDSQRPLGKRGIETQYFSRQAEVRGLFVPFNIMSEHFFISTSGAPFATVIILSPSLITTDIIFRSDENGISSVLGFWRLSFTVSVPDRSAAATIAASVGSPDTLPLPSYFASQQSAASEKSFLPLRRSAEFRQTASRRQ